MVVSEGITSIELYTDAFNEVTVTMADRIFPVDTIAHDSWFATLEKADAAWVPLVRTNLANPWSDTPNGFSTVVEGRLPMCSFD